MPIRSRKARLDGSAAGLYSARMQPDSPPTQSSSKHLQVWIAPLAWIIALVLIIRFFEPIALVVLGILAACIIAATLYPLMKYIPGPRGVDVAVLGLGLLAVVIAVGFAVWWPLGESIDGAVQRWPETREQINAVLLQWSPRLGLQEPLNMDKLLAGLGDFFAGSGGRQLFTRGADVLLGILVSLLFALVGSIFLLSEDPERLMTPALRLFSSRNRAAMRMALYDLAPRFRRWVIGTLTGMTVVFCASALGYTAIGFEFALPMALVAGFAEIVPTVGPAVACAVAAVIGGAAQGTGTAIGILAVYGIIQAIEAYLILPIIMRGAVNMHPAVTLFSVILWGKIFGVPGLMLAIPINLTLWTLLEHFRIRPRERQEEAEGLLDRPADPVCKT